MFAQGRKDRRTNADHYYVTPSLRGGGQKGYTGWIYTFIQTRNNRVQTYGWVVAILKMATGRNFLMSGINLGHHNLPGSVALVRRSISPKVEKNVRVKLEKKSLFPAISVLCFFIP
jgi:hypothetical protein